MRSKLEPYEDQYVGAGGNGGGSGRRQLAAVSRSVGRWSGDRFSAGRMEGGIGEEHPLEDRHPGPGPFQPRDLGRPHFPHHGRPGLWRGATQSRPLWRYLSLIHISEPTRLGMISYAVFCLKKKKK